MAGLPAGARTVSCHLGAGASLCAIRDGRSLDTTMGFTPLEGLVMATRSGSVDPGLVLWIAEHEQLSPQDVTAALVHESGLLGLAGTADMAELERRRDVGDPRAELAFDIFVDRAAAHVAAMATALGGLDLVCFTGGIGEHSADVRAAVGQRLEWLGLGIDGHRNAASEVGDRLISPEGAQVRAVVVTAREDLEIARQCRGMARNRGADGTP